MWHRFLDFVSSLKLTIVCLSAALVLVFVGTLAQVHYGTHVVQERYFQSMWIWWPAESRGFRIPVFPGGHLLGAVLLVNLAAAHLRRFRLSWRNAGIHLIHGGLIVMLAGGLFTDLFSVESQMKISQGETRNYSEDARLRELVIIDKRNSTADQVTAISEVRLRKGGSLELSNLPFRLVIQRYFENSQLRKLAPAEIKNNRAVDNGFGSHVSIGEIPQATAVDGHDVKSAIIQLVATGVGGESASVPPGTWLVSEGIEEAQTFSCAGGTWEIAIRPVRYYKPYSLTLEKFTHERYPGTNIPKNFSSQIALDDPSRSEHRNVLIYMNHPFRYGGETYYQAGFGPDDQSTILQVVRNPSFVAPYIGCVVIGFGLLFQFSIHFVGFTRRTKAAPAK